MADAPKRIELGEQKIKPENAIPNIKTVQSSMTGQYASGAHICQKNVYFK